MWQVGSSSSSKAVLAALRALQDKIRRLEAERSTALDESNQLRHQLKQQEIEFEHVKQRDQLQSQKNISEVRHAYDKLLSDKAELEIRLSKLEDKSKVLMSSSEDMQVKVRLLEEEKHASSMKIREMENQRNSIESQIKLAQIKEEGQLLPTTYIYSYHVLFCHSHVTTSTAHASSLLSSYIISSIIPSVAPSIMTSVNRDVPVVAMGEQAS